MTRPQLALLLLRVTLELAVVATLAYWGYRQGSGTTTSVVYALLAPAVGFGIWGAVDFHQAGRLAEPLRLLEELAISALAAVGLWVSGQPAFAFALAALSLVYHVAVYATGTRLLKPRATAA